MLVQCCVSSVDGVPTLKQHWLSVFCQLLIGVDGREYRMSSHSPFIMNFRVILCLFKFIYLYIHVIANLHMTTTCFIKYIYKIKHRQGTLTTLLHSLSFILEQHQVLC